MTFYTIPNAIHRLNHRDPEFKIIDLFGQQLTDSNLTELIDCLLVHPDVVERVYLASNWLTDETGIKLARYLASSSTVKWLLLYNNQFSPVTYLALAAALRINTSLRVLCIHDNQIVDKNCINCINCINAAFVDALLLNPNRPAESYWRLYSWDQNEFERFKTIAEELGHPSMQALLAMRLF